MKLRKLAPKIVQNKVILIRVDFNVPIKNGVVTETTRIEESIPTLKFLLTNGAKRIHILTHIGRPDGKPDPELSTKILVPVIEKFLGEKVEFRPDFSPGKSKIQLHENTRFWPGDEKNDAKFSQEILKNLTPDIFVNDGFAVSHRAHASVVGFAKAIPCYPGFLLEKEILSLSPLLTKKKIPGLAVLVGGVKMETKVPVLRHFAVVAENILVGGGLANTFQVAEGFDVGKSLYEKKEIETAQEVMELAEKEKTGFHLPIDSVCAEDPDSETTLTVPIQDVSGSMKIFDIGPHTVASFVEILQHSKIIIWNGPLGLTEKKPFANGTKMILEAVRKNKSAKAILGGGDTLKMLQKFGVSASEFFHVSTGGSAMLEFLAGDTLPGIEILREK